jgi:hypothetical protein
MPLEEPTRGGGTGAAGDRPTSPTRSHRGRGPAPGRPSGRATCCRGRTSRRPSAVSSAGPPAWGPSFGRQLDPQRPLLGEGEAPDLLRRGSHDGELVDAAERTGGMRQAQRLLGAAGIANRDGRPPGAQVRRPCRTTGTSLRPRTRRARRRGSPRRRATVLRRLPQAGWRARARPRCRPTPGVTARAAGRRHPGAAPPRPAVPAGPGHRGEDPRPGPTLHTPPRPSAAATRRNARPRSRCGTPRRSLRHRPCGPAWRGGRRAASRARTGRNGLDERVPRRPADVVGDQLDSRVLPHVVRVVRAPLQRRGDYDATALTNAAPGDVLGSD